MTATPTASVETSGKPASAAALAAPHRFLLLDGLRGVAAFAVITDHVPSDRIMALLPGRYLAVEFFWVLSGFVLAHAYGERLRSGMSNLEFLRLRMVRLYPLYLLGLAIGVIAVVGETLQGSGRPLSETAIIALVGLTFLPMPPVLGSTAGYLYPLEGPAWTLFFELVANVIYGAIVRLLSLRVLAVILVVTGIWTAVVFPLAHAGGAGWLWPHFGAALPRVLYCFFAGVFLFQLKSVVRLPGIPAWLAVLLLVAILAFPATGEAGLYYEVVASLVLMPGLVALASGSRVSGKVATACAMAGYLSYGVYLIHRPLYQCFRLVLHHFRIEAPGSLMVVAVAISAAILAGLATRYYDTPVRTWLGGRRKRLAAAK